MKGRAWIQIVQEGGTDKSKMVGIFHSEMTNTLLGNVSILTFN